MAAPRVMCDSSQDYADADIKILWKFATRRSWCCRQRSLWYQQGLSVCTLNTVLQAQNQQLLRNLQQRQARRTTLHDGPCSEPACKLHGWVWLLQENEVSQLGALCSPHGHGAAAAGPSPALTSIAPNVQRALASSGMTVVQKPIGSLSASLPQTSTTRPVGNYLETSASNHSELRDAMARRDAEARQRGTATAPAGYSGHYQPHAPGSSAVRPPPYWQPHPQHMPGASGPAAGSQLPQPAVRAATDSQAPGLPKPFRPFRVNDHVRLQGLAKSPSFNGLLGHIRELRDDGRYVVTITDSSKQEVAVRPECLTLV